MKGSGLGFWIMILVSFDFFFQLSTFYIKPLKSPLKVEFRPFKFEKQRIDHLQWTQFGLIFPVLNLKKIYIFMKFVVNEIPLRKMIKIFLY